MLDISLFSSIARQLMSADEVEVEGKRLPVRRTSSRRLRMVAFTMGGRQYAAIEQNAEKPSRWGQLARSGHRVVQFKDVQANRFVAVAVNGGVKVYGGVRGGVIRLPTVTSELNLVPPRNQACISP
jgi:hypothetical protein